LFAVYDQRFNFASEVRPDYPYKFFPDHRNCFNLLMETLAMDGVNS